MTIRNCLIIFVFIIAVKPTKAQLCQGSLGDPVVNITFGSGPNPGPSPKFPTNYGFVTNDCPNDGYYTIRNSTTSCFGDSWHSLTKDHTGDANGYFMLVNASVFPGTFYVDTIRGLCPSTTFEFASWVVNVLKTTACNSAGITPDLTFTIETTDGLTKLQTFNTGPIQADASPQWKQYGFFFKTPVGISDIVIRIVNNAPGGCGNDLALDDITFRPCGPLVNASIVNNNATTSVNSCVGDTTAFKFSATVSAGYTAPSYQWQLSTDNGITWKDIPGAVNSSYTRQPTGAGNYQYRLAVSEAGNINISTCRVASNALTVVVNANPVTSAVNDGPKCSGAAIALTATGGTNYTWTGPNNFTATGQTVSINNTVASGKYYVLVTNSNSCKNIDSTVVALYDNPVTKFSSSVPACENGPVQFTDQSTTATGQTITKYNWDFGDGSVDVTVNPAHIFSPAKTYAVTLITSTDKACSDTLVQQVLIHDLPVPDFILPEVCLSDPFAAFTNASAIADNSEAQFNYLWNFGDANATSGNPNISTQKNPQHSYTSIGVYNVQLTVTSKDGCVNNITKPFTVNGALPLANFTVDNTANLCSNQDITITDHSSVNFGSITKVEIYWDYQNDPANKVTDEFPANGKKYSYRYADFGNPATKDFVIKYIAYSGINCVNETQQTITLKASPLAQFSAMNAVCEGITPFTITQAREINGISGTGIFSGSGVSANGLFNPQAAGNGVHSIVYTYTADNGCKDATAQSILVYPQPTVNAGPDRTLLEGGFITIDATATGNNITYLWTPNTAIENNLVITPKVNPVDDITYTLTVKSADNCISKDDVFIKVLKTPLIPNAFSPNGDGINDTWIINYLDSYPGVTVQVYNRYGQVVYRSVGYSKAWDGTFNGTPLPVGTYYYIIDRKVAAPKLSGWVAILR
ncbi:T9SS type B sorting domain-containing protein [Panacibacter ginsenosidivorans]|uniref:T9SS type B sorting domain-containing protein n=1 Tax=Panacibacter ginsenosidivorans TaxID=1813871 RepID=A0A5B8VFR4_9BACT|nr:gliding motility-associated C-terminal domain-containing protein [Panacibacter ginsenosidivorans]QEC69901.1 T9SS type B sorting domain-containing protein [Panacibacter ginsenosidivorans]